VLEIDNKFPKGGKNTPDRVADGKVVECWTNADDLGLMQLLGMATAPQQV
jgi:hypothetical protein